MNKGCVLPPVPHCHNDILFKTAGSRRSFRKLTAGNSFGPVGPHFERRLTTKTIHRIAHLIAALACLHPVVPCSNCRVERGLLVNDTCSLVPKLVTELTTLLHVVHPVGLSSHRRVDSVAAIAGSRELASCRRFNQRIPIVSGIVLSSISRSWCYHSS